MYISGSLTIFFGILGLEEDPGFLVFSAIALYFFCLSYNSKREEEERINKNKKQLINLKRSADDGDSESQHQLSLRSKTEDGIENDKSEAFSWLEKAAKQGHAQAQNDLGKMYERGEQTVEDYKEAFKWYKKSANQGCADAQYNLGIIFYSGKGTIKQSILLSYAMFLLASSSGHKRAIQKKEDLKKSLNEEQIEKGQELAKKIKTNGIDIE